MKYFDIEENHTEMDEELCTYILERDQGLCTNCGMQGHHIHHIAFRSNGGKHRATNLAYLCHTCHDAVHFGGMGKRQVERITNSIKVQIELNEKRLRRYLV